MKYCPVVLFIVSSTACMNPPAGAHSEHGIDIGMLNQADVNTTFVAGGPSVPDSDSPPSAHRLPPVVHGPAYYPAWRVDESPGSLRLIHLRGDGFSFRERDDDK